MGRGGLCPGPAPRDELALPGVGQDLGYLAQASVSFENNSQAAILLLALTHLTGDKRYRARSEDIIRTWGERFDMEGFMAAPYASAVQRLADPVLVHVVGAREEPAVRHLAAEAPAPYHPWRLVQIFDPEADREVLAALGYPTAGPPQAYICGAGRCLPPTTAPRQALETLITS